ncbi:unnamed protein product [Mytilus coruscus]|uniref:Uncharacterized protein n=1 Tax=Mytilus coruscus TaxID=42192 RepID=A0A6J8BW94_MYTCO|nr:unnamed protein product [Mytilus coruscus]
MLNLMIQYQKSLRTNDNKLDSSVELLKNTSQLIKNFRDCRPLTDISNDISDDRLKVNDDELHFFKEWKTSVIKDNKLSNKEKCLISHQTRQDISSLIIGFKHFCINKPTRYSGSSIIPSRINTDPIENIFCQERSLHNGACTNPTYLGYCNTMNSVILGESTISRKSNTGGHNADPFSYHTKNPLNPSKKQRH